MKQCKCGSTDFFTEIKGSTTTGLYCSACGKWQKWLNKDEIRAFDYSNKPKKAITTNADRIRSMRLEFLQKADFHIDTKNTCDIAIKALEENEQLKAEIEKLKNDNYLLVSKFETEKMDSCECTYTDTGCANCEWTLMKAEIARLKEKEVAGVQSHSEKDILKGAISLMESVFKGMIEYMKYMDFEWDNDNEEENPSFGISYFEMVQRLFLQNTSHSGGTSTRKKCEELGVPDDVVIELDWSE